jgi:hypothetical protein
MYIQVHANLPQLCFFRNMLPSQSAVWPKRRPRPPNGMLPAGREGTASSCAAECMCAQAHGTMRRGAAMRRRPRWPSPHQRPTSQRRCNITAARHAHASQTRTRKPHRRRAASTAPQHYRFQRVGAAPPVPPAATSRCVLYVATRALRRADVEQLARVKPCRLYVL